MRKYFDQLGMVIGWFTLGSSVAMADNIRGPVVTADGYVLIAVERSGGTASFEHHLAEPKKEFCIHQGLEDMTFQPSDSCFRVLATSNRNGQSYVTETRRCPTKSGWHEVLVSSDLYESYEVVWSLHTENGSTQLQWELKGGHSRCCPHYFELSFGRTDEAISEELGYGWWLGALHGCGSQQGSRVVPIPSFHSIRVSNRSLIQVRQIRLSWVTTTLYRSCGRLKR